MEMKLVTGTKAQLKVLKRSYVVHSRTLNEQWAITIFHGETALVMSPQYPPDLMELTEVEYK